MALQSARANAAGKGVHRDLEVPASALPLVLQLLEEIDYLHAEAAQLQLRLRHWEGHG